ncbi:MAG: DUF4105 domain-containing protein [Treponema sp.]|jgi:hypothetical protein|nr:DUF4105 domain-containing protein [Treponema sp.]
MNDRFLLSLLLLLALGVQCLGAQTDAAVPDRFTLKIAVMGPGDELYFWWGHIALVIEDHSAGTARFYDYGIFSFENEHFYRNFAFGRLLYSCGVSSAERSFQTYIATNRDITLYTLDLSPETEEAIRRFAENNVLPENRDYYYHHFKDNCATRIRDIIDLATQGQFKARFGDAPGRYTLRQHVRRHTWFSPFMDWALNFLMGQDIDVPITIWEEMFLPAEIGLRISDFTYTDDTGVERPLVSSVEVLNRAENRPAVLDIPRRQWPYELAVGIVLAAMLACFARIYAKRPLLGRPLLAFTQSALGLFFGLMGSLLFFMSFFTNHDYTWHNSNILFINPVLLAIVPLGIIAATDKRPGKRWLAEQFLRALWTYVLFGGLLSMLIKLTPNFYQQNQVTQALVLPAALALSYIPGWAQRLRQAQSLRAEQRK